MNFSVSPTEMLKLVSTVWSRLHMMKSMMSGWSTRRIPMLAPRRVPPCLIVSVAASKTFMKESGPEEIPLVERTTSLAGRMREKAKPVPPPLLWISAVCLIASKISSMESPTGRTKQADSWPSSRPAFIRVGELGRNSREVIIRLNSLASSVGFFPLAKAFFGVGDGFGHALEHVGRGLQNLPFLVALEVAAFEDGDGVRRQFGQRGGFFCGHRSHPD